jgi:hypothetical protein
MNAVAADTIRQPPSEVGEARTPNSTFFDMAEKVRFADVTSTRVSEGRRPTSIYTLA